MVQSIILPPAPYIALQNQSVSVAASKIAALNPQTKVSVKNRPKGGAYINVSQVKFGCSTSQCQIPLKMPSDEAPLYVVNPSFTPNPSATKRLAQKYAAAKKGNKDTYDMVFSGKTVQLAPTCLSNAGINCGY